MNLSPEHASRDGAAVNALVADITRIGLVLRSADPDQDIGSVIDDLEAASTWLARTEAHDWAGLRGKVVVLRQRLEEMLDTELPAEALTLALVASVLRDVERLGS